jgi:uncharacterized protein (TIGR02996 family)
MSSSNDALGSFLAAIAADPDDNEIRLVFADWLSEQGDARGELMRLQCEEASLSPDDPRSQVLCQQAAELRSQHAATLHGHLPDGVQVDFERGLLVVRSAPHVLADGHGAKWWRRYRPWTCRLALRGLENAAGLRLAVSRGILARVSVLDLESSGLSDRGLKAMTGLSDLRVLLLRFTQVTDAGLRSLLSLEGLQELDLGDCRQLTDEGMDTVGRLLQLKQLRLQRTRVTDMGLRALAGLQGLEELDLTYTVISDAGLAALSGMERLRVLRLCSPALTGAGLTALPRPGCLSELDLDGCHRVNDKGLVGLIGLESIEKLALRATSVTDEGLEVPARLPRLRQVDLSWTRVTPEGLAMLASLPQLRVVHFQGTRRALTKAQAALPHCRVS